MRLVGGCDGDGTGRPRQCCRTFRTARCADAGTDLDDHECCPCARPSPVILDGGSTAQSHAEQTKILIARRDAAETENTRLLKAQRIKLDHRTTFIYRLGTDTDPRPADEDDEDDQETQEEFNARIEEDIAAAGSYERFRTQDNNTLRRFDPIAYGLQLAADKARQYPDPDEPPF
ncbi:hypothetical protein ABIB25_003234 [Nakamurella sp. UYEF19]|uniref:hypothetical protein n=1 Tax=Nakamurella sp. UYEF19 TaxID=1756392 RepID=UPI0033976613